jgi:exodeoxyribonuclease V gamma subunit
VEPGEVTVDDLARLFEHPARGYLRQRLGIGLAGEDPEPADALPLELAGLEKWAVGERFLDARLRDVAPGVCVDTEVGRGVLPPGVLGRQAARAVGRTADVIVGLVRAPLPALPVPFDGEPADSVDVDVDLPSGHRLTGTVPCGAQAAPGTLLRVSFSSLAPKHRIRAWVELLAVTAADPGAAWRAVVVGKHFNGAKRCVLGPVPPELAREVLADLAVLRDRGLCEPLPAPVRAAEAYARRRRNAGAEQAMVAAEQEWVKKGMPEHADPAHVLLYGVEAPFEAVTAAVGGHDDAGPEGLEPTRFGTLALRIWVPLLRHEEQAS